MTKTPILNYIQQTKPSHSKGKLSRLFLFLIGSIGTQNSIFDSRAKMTMTPTIDHTHQPIKQLIPEYKIEFCDRYLQPSHLIESRKLLEIQNVLEDEFDKDWSFVPKAILNHRKRIIPRHVIRMNRHVKPELKVERNEHIRLKLLWKDGSISWIAGDALQLHNPFIFIPYVIKRKLYNHKDFKWLQDYIENNEIYKKKY